MFARWSAFYVLLAIIVIALAASYVSIKSIVSKGPNDWGAQSHVLQVVQDKYGSGASIEPNNYEFKNDVLHPPNGTYVFHYNYAGQQGKVTCYYDPTTGAFKRDVVGPPGPVSATP